MPTDSFRNDMETQGTCCTTKSGCGRPLLTLLEGLVWSSSSTLSPGAVEVVDVVTDSRKSGRGSLFVALPGSRTDGHLYLGQVCQSGAVALIVESGRLPIGFSAPAGCCVVEVADSFLACARIAANFYGHPARSMTMIGVTGTNGKTTVTYLVESVLLQLGLSVGVVGTVNYRYRDATGRRVVAPAPFTTPEPLLLQSLLRKMADAGVQYVVMEVSSHALVQHRLGNLQFDVAAFTNFTRDHLDYHRSMEGYFLAKGLLFRDHLKAGGRAVLTRSAQPDPAEEERIATLRELCAGHGAQVIECNRIGCDISPLELQSELDHTRLTLRVGKEEVKLASPLVGDFNVANLQTALGVGLALGVSVSSLAGRLAVAQGAPGRMERVLPPLREAAFRPAVFIDYAHTPDALEKALQTLLRLPHRRLICAFGCGGDRDKGKRPLMGTIAARLCDRVIVTDDNPRSESSRDIVAGICEGINAAGMPARDASWLFDADSADQKGFVVLQDRAEAIAAAIAAGGVDDIVLVAGKGHELYQQDQEGRHFFDDRLEALRGLTAWSTAGVMAAVGGRWQGAKPGAMQLGNVVTDSRKVAPGDIFVALQGENFDGHAFLSQVAAAGAGCAVITCESAANIVAPANLPCMLVPDTLRALGDLAAYRLQVMRELIRRDDGAGPRHPSFPLVIGLTGSCGKTTVKEMIATIFVNAFTRDSECVWPNPVLKTQGNFNNLVGLPLSLLPVGPEQRVLILEMGMNRPGEIEQLARIADPDIACIVNVYAAHLEGLHSIAGVARAKEELFAGCRSESIFAVNLDDPHVRWCAERYQQRKILYAVGAEGAPPCPEVWGSSVTNPGSQGQSFLLHVREQSQPVTLQVPGVHNIANAIAAAAVCHAAGLGIAEIAAGLSLFVSADKRMQVVAGRNGLHILNDTYNANPASMRAGIETLVRQSCAARMAVLGDMLELGPTSAEAHREAGRIVAGCHVDYLALIGSFARDTAAGAREAGMEDGQIRIFAEKRDAVAWIDELCAKKRLQAGDWVLVKGSRGMRLEDVVEGLRQA